MKRVLSLLSFGICVVVMAACQQGPFTTPTPTPGATKPNVIIVTPPSNTSVQTGDPVNIQSTSASSEGIVLVELLVDGQVVHNSPTPNGQPQQVYSVIQSWTATTVGSHTVTVRATDSRLGTGEASITLNVAAKIAEATATLVIQPTQVISTATPLAKTSTPGAPATLVPSTPSGPATCTLASAFIADVTIPDGTVIAPGGAFVKTWAIQNTGSCTWGGGYGAILVGGQSFGAASPQPIPAAAPGNVINISINMVAPYSPGVASSIWQLQASNGIPFGAKFDAVINVPGPPTPRPPTPRPPTPIPPSGCNGTPVMAGFGVNPQTINAGQVTTLSWGYVQNANSVYLTTPSGTQGVGTPGSLQVQPSQTTTYTLTAYCNNVPNQLQVTVFVNGGGGGCSGTPVFNGFFASPQTINAGQESTLNWGLVQNANAVFLQLPNRSEGVATPGSRNVKPGQTTTYTLVAYCGNNQVSISTTVNVNGGCSGKPVINGFSANPSTINKGQSSNLSWGLVTNANSVTLVTPNGNSGVGTPGNITVSPQQTSTYTLIAACGSNTSQASVTVTVNQPITPTPTTPPQNNQVTNIQANQTGNQSYNLKVDYYWNGLDAPAHMETIGINKDGKVVTPTEMHGIQPNAFKTVNISINVNGNRSVRQWQACIVGVGGNDLACKTVNAQ